MILISNHPISFFQVDHFPHALGGNRSNRRGFGPFLPLGLKRAPGLPLMRTP
jgi:hypothetical protein